jgi:hypothetical protein
MNCIAIDTWNRKDMRALYLAKQAMHLLYYSFG